MVGEHNSKKGTIKLIQDQKESDIQRSRGKSLGKRQRELLLTLFLTQSQCDNELSGLGVQRKLEHIFFIVMTFPLP